MAVSFNNTSSADPAGYAENGGAQGNGTLRIFVFALFFVFGGITSLNDVLIPKLKTLFTLSYGQAMLVQSAFFAAYFIVSFPAARLVRRVGYLRGASIGLLVMTAGCLLFAPAARAASFELFLLALFVIAGGITLVQVVANPLISALGAPRTASSRLTFAQGFNSLGTTLFPYIGAILILGSLASVDPATLSGAALDAFRAQESSTLSRAYLGLAAALAVLALVVWTQRRSLTESKATGGGGLVGALDLFRDRRFALGTLGIFLYVGAEVAIGSLIVNYLTHLGLGIDEQRAGQHVAYYWGGAMIGRFIGAAVLRMFRPGRVLALAATAAILLILVSANSAGVVSMWSLLAIGLFNSIMFPTIFSLASEGLGQRSAEGSGLICMAIVGGAVIPPLTGLIADHAGLKIALALPAACYAIILLYGLYCGRSRGAEGLSAH